MTAGYREHSGRERESGGNPERTGHCKRGAGSYGCHCGLTVRRRDPGEDTQSQETCSDPTEANSRNSGLLSIRRILFDCRSRKTWRMEHSGPHDQLMPANCSAAKQLPQFYKHSKSADLLRKSLLSHVLRVPSSKALSCKHERLFDLLTLASSTNR